jgi:DNA-binding beta-propeller fold protein YncE
VNTSPIWDAASNRLYINCFAEDHVAVLDCRTDSIIDEIHVREPVGLTINTLRRKLYVHSWANSSLAVIDLVTNSVMTYVRPGSDVYASCYVAAVDKYYCNGEGGLAAVDGATDSIVRQIPLPQGFATTAMEGVEPESLVMVAAFSGNSDSVFTVDARGDSVRCAVTVRAPFALVYSPYSNVLYCTNGRNSNNLSVVSADGSRVLSYVAVGEGPQSLLVCPAHERLYVGHGGMTTKIYVVRDRVGLSEAAPRAVDKSDPAAVLASDVYEHLGPTPAILLDASGRRAADVRPGRNDVTGLAPGVYFIRTADAAPVRRVVIVH